MFGTGIGTYIPFIAYLGFWVAILIALFRKPLYGLYYMIPFLPYRTMRDHFVQWPLGGNVLTILVLATFLGALLHGKKLPKSKLPLTWLIFGAYMYFSMWMGSALTSAPAPIWLNDLNFVIWKDYMLTPLIFVAAAMVVDDRKSIRTVLILTAFALLMIARSSLMDSLTHTWSTFDESKRSGGPLGFGSNQTAAYLCQFAMFYWAFALYLKRRKAKLISYATAAVTILACMYCFSRAAYLAIVACVILLGLLKDRKLIVIAAVFLLFWQVVLPAAVTERINMTHNEDGQLEASAQERVDLWEDAEQTFLHYPIFGTGFATFLYGDHVDGLKDTHNWYVKLLVETGVVGFGFAVVLIYQVFSVSVRLFRKARDPMYAGLGLGLVICMTSCVITNFFGDRWTYTEITAPLWVLIGAALRADQFTREGEPAPVEQLEPAKPARYAYAH